MRARAPALAVAFLLLSGSAGCTSGGSDPEGMAACLATLQFQGRDYTGAFSARPPRSAGPAGSARVPGCNDTGPDTPEEQPWTVEVEAIVGVPVTEAVLVGRTVYTVPGSTVAQRFPSWFGPVTCDRTGRLTVEGVWTTLQGTVREDPLRPPYVLQIRVDDLPASGDLARAEVTVRVDSPGVSSLTRSDAQELLLTGGRITAQVHCADGAFHADRVQPVAP